MVTFQSNIFDFKKGIELKVRKDCIVWGMRRGNFTNWFALQREGTFNELFTFIGMVLLTVISSFLIVLESFGRSHEPP